MAKKLKTCNQCSEPLQPMNKQSSFTSKNFYYCVAPACPNFALLQIPAEEIK